MKNVVVIPTYNERENLELLINKIHQYGSDLDVLIVDDNSPDGTGEVAEKLRDQNPDHLFVLHRNKKDGLGRAYVDGFRWALGKSYDVILQMDADLSHDPSYLPRFMEQIDHFDLVLGSRYMHGISVVNWDLKRLMLSKLATAYVRVITQMPFTDTTSGFKCWRREVLESIGVEQAFSNGYLFQIEMTYKAYKQGFRGTEVPIIFVDRSNGRSKMNHGIILEAIWGVLKLRFCGRKRSVGELESHQYGNHSLRPRDANKGLL
jgi:dolichol-phosphate mannosyltransferase